MSKNVKIMLIVACFVLAAGIFSFNSGIFSGGGGDGKLWFKCVNPNCNQVYSLTQAEFSKALGNNPMMTGQQQAFKCQKCDQQSAYIAQKCEKKECGEIFIIQMPGQANQDFSDKCPKCGYSSIEQMEKEQK